MYYFLTKGFAITFWQKAIALFCQKHYCIFCQKLVHIHTEICTLSLITNLYTWCIPWNLYTKYCNLYFLCKTIDTVLYIPEAWCTPPLGNRIIAEWGEFGIVSYVGEGGGGSPLCVFMYVDVAVHSFFLFLLHLPVSSTCPSDLWFHEIKK